MNVKQLMAMNYIDFDMVIILASLCLNVYLFLYNANVSVSVTFKFKGLCQNMKLNVSRDSRDSASTSKYV